MGDLWVWEGGNKGQHTISVHYLIWEEQGSLKLKSRKFQNGIKKSIYVLQRISIVYWIDANDHALIYYVSIYIA
jgi:hypothetical protein